MQLRTIRIILATATIPCLIIIIIMAGILGPIGLSVAQKQQPKLFDQSIISYNLLWMFAYLLPLCMMIIASLAIVCLLDEKPKLEKVE